jgi:hypothetical protein
LIETASDFEGQLGGFSELAGRLMSPGTVHGNGREQNGKIPLLVPIASRFRHRRRQLREATHDFTIDRRSRRNGIRFLECFSHLTVRDRKDQEATPPCLPRDRSNRLCYGRTPADIGVDIRNQQTVGLKVIEQPDKKRDQVASKSGPGIAVPYVLDTPIEKNQAAKESKTDSSDSRINCQ